MCTLTRINPSAVSRFFKYMRWNSRILDGLITMVFECFLHGFFAVVPRFFDMED
jgi:hypothetical protein